MNILNDKLSIQQLVEMFDYQLKNKVMQNTKEEEPSTKISPSMLGGCLRQNYYKLTGTPTDEQKDTFELQMIQHDGAFTHETIQKYIKELFQENDDWEWVDAEEYVKNNNLKLKVLERKGLEVKFYSEQFDSNFLCDGIIRYKPTNELFVLEIKTEVSSKWNKRTSIEPKHVVQGTFYATVFGINNIIFYYINRDFKTTKALPLKVTEEMKEEFVYNRIGYLFYCRDNKILPPRISDDIYHNPNCLYCKYKSYCANNFLGGKEKDGTITYPDYELKEKE